jgi:DNA polymerase III epsilon subunit-like protein
MPVRETMLAFLDTETTGLVPGMDEVTEIAVILADFRLNEIDRYEAKIKTVKTPPAEVAQINGWNAEVWAREAISFRSFQDFLKRRIPFGEVAVIVGANPTFDRRIIDEFYYKPHRTFFPLSYHTVDVCALGTMLRVAGILDIPNVKLTTMALALGIPHVAHRAMGDVEAAMGIFRHVLGMVGKKTVQV